MSTELARQKAQIEHHTRQLEDHERAIAGLRTQNSVLTKSSEGFLVIRRRFLDVYKRDVVGMTDLRGSPAIFQGNVVAHHGDALTDAYIYNRDSRKDFAVFRQPYGLDRHQVLNYGMRNYVFVGTSCPKLIKWIADNDEGCVIAVLNAHATLVAQGNTLPNSLDKAFKLFIAQLEANWERSLPKNRTLL